MTTVRAPGVYYEPSEQRIPQLSLGRTGMPVFLGVTRRGPLDRPMRITSLDHFEEIFGEPIADGYLISALNGFFDNGGEICHVLRIAREKGRPGEDVALTAELTALDGAGAEILQIEAQDPGTWGNQLQVDIQPTPQPSRTFLTRDAAEGDELIQVKTTHGIQVGTLVEISDGEGSHWVEIQGLKGKTLTLSVPLPRAFKSAAPTYVSPHTFDLRVSGPFGEGAEIYPRLSLHGASQRFVERLINQQSRLIRVQIIRGDTPLGESLPAPLLGRRLEGGQDGIADLGPDDFIGYDRGPSFRRGLWALVEHPQIDLVVIPDLMRAYERSERFKTLRDVDAVQEAAITLCERSLNRFAILDLPPGGDYEEALRWRRQFDSPHAAFYYPWVVILEGGKRRVVPPSGHIAGIYARSDKDVGVHKAPANEIIEGVVDLDVLLQDAHLALLNQAGVNCLRAFASRGLRVWGARTASSEPEWRYVNVRRTISAIHAAIDQGCQWVVFEPNGPTLWKRLTRLITGFLLDLRTRGILAGAQPEDAFYVLCNEETNPPDAIDRGMLITEIGIAVTRPVEFIVFRLVQRLEDEAQQLEES